MDVQRRDVPSSSTYSADRQPVIPGDDLSGLVARCQASSILLGRGLSYSTSTSTNSSNNNSSSNSDSNRSSLGNSNSSSGANLIRNISITANVAGTLRFKRPGEFWVDNVSSKLYMPEEGDQVVGIVDDKGGDFYKVNIRAGNPVILSRLGFEAATKRNRPEFKRGDMLFCRVLKVPLDTDVEVTCISTGGVKKEWTSGEAVFGGLSSEGSLVYVPLSFAKYLLRPECVLLEAIARHYAYEVSIGANGVVWLRAGSAAEQAIVRMCLLNCQDFDDKDIPNVVDKLVRKVQGK